MIVSTKGRVEGSDKEYRSEKDPSLGNLPLVVLVNGLSASASEIVAGAIQDLDRGVIVGETTYGKGLVQTVVSLTRESALKITTAKYYVPSGRCIQKDNPDSEAEGEMLASLDGDGITNISESGGGTPTPHAEDKEKEPAQVFHTKSGRSVYGGGGIKPDVEVPVPQLSQFELGLIRKAMPFNYAVAYAGKHPNLKQSDFAIADNLMAEFRQFLQDKKFTYTSQSETRLAELKKAAEREGYLNDIQSSVTALEQALQREKEDDFTKSHDFIHRELEREIAGKLFGSRAQVETAFDEDAAVQRALEILQDANAYNAILAGAKTK